MEKAVIKKFELVICANVERARFMKAHYHLNKRPLVIRNISKPTLGSVKKDVLLNKYYYLGKNKSELFVVYMGDISITRGLRQIVEAMLFLPKEIVLIIIGGGPDLVGLEDIVRFRKDLSGRVRFIGHIPQEFIQDVLSLCDLGLIVYSMKGLNNYYCSPNKIFEYAQAGLPVVSTPQPPLVKMIERYQVGKIVKCYNEFPDAKEFSMAIIEAFYCYTELVSKLDQFLLDNSFQEEHIKLREAIQMKIVNNKIHQYGVIH
jgi:glycosyltransferase involved in cell wall biosynthesis